MFSLAFYFLCIFALLFCVKNRKRHLPANIVLCVAILCGIYNLDSSRDYPVEVHTNIARYAFVPTMFNNATLFEQNRYGRNNVNVWFAADSSDISWITNTPHVTTELTALKIRDAVTRAVHTFVTNELYCDSSKCQLGKNTSHGTLLLLERVDFFPIAIFFNVGEQRVLDVEEARDAMKSVRFIAIYNI